MKDILNNLIFKMRDLYLRAFPPAGLYVECGACKNHVSEFVLRNRKVNKQDVLYLCQQCNSAARMEGARTTTIKVDEELIILRKLDGVRFE